MNWAMENENNGDISQQPKIKHKAKHDKPKPWDDDPNIDHGKTTSLTYLRMKPECLKSAPSPFSFLDTEVKSKLAIGSLLFYFSSLGIWLISGFWFFNCLVQRSTCKRSGQLWNPLWKSGISCELNLVSFCKCFFFFFN